MPASAPPLAGTTQFPAAGAGALLEKAAELLSGAMPRLLVADPAERALG